MSDFSTAKVGDRVFDYVLQEWGEIIALDKSARLSITVKFGGELYTSYLLDGRLFARDKLPILFWDAVPPITPPPKPVSIPPVDTLVEVRDCGSDPWERRYSAGELKNSYLLCWVDGATSKTASNKSAWRQWRVCDE